MLRLFVDHRSPHPTRIDLGGAHCKQTISVGDLEQTNLVSPILARAMLDAEEVDVHFAKEQNE